ncbi:MAG TPA: hypothetical protein VFN22_04245 [Gemmatimonadales bacterium]|nr:hypothetical protein [Gemmatimonadales bacterium]
MRFFTRVVGVTIALIAVAGSRSTATFTSVLPCRNAPDTAGAVLATLGEQLAHPDSTERAVLGLTVAPGSAALVTDSLVCASALQAFNTHVASYDSALMQTSTYVVAAGLRYGVPRIPAVPGHPSVTVILDTSFAVVAEWESPD